MQESGEKMRDELLRIFSSDPYLNYMNFRILEVREGYAKVEGKVKEHHLNFNGVCHGGYIFSLADVAFSFASNSHNRKAFAVSISVEYIRGAEEGDTLIAIAEETGSAGRLGFYDMKVFKNDETIAKFQAIVYRKKEAIVQSGKDSTF